MGKQDYKPSGKTLKDRLEEGRIINEFFQSKLRDIGIREIYNVINIHTSKLYLYVRYLNSDGIEREGEDSITDIFFHQWDPHLIKIGEQ